MAERLGVECSICHHEQAADIDAALLGGTTIRSVSGTYGLSRSAVGRHKLNHLTSGALADLERDAREHPSELSVVDVHGGLSSLAARLEAALTAAERSRKPQVAVAISRELRQVLEAAGRLQADPEVKAAANVQEFQKITADGTLGYVSACLDFVLEQAGLADGVWHHLFGEALRAGYEAPRDAQGCPTVNLNAAVDTTDAKRALAERAAAVEREVEARVEVEVRRRLALVQLAPPALEAARPGVPVHDGPGAAVVAPAACREPLEGEVLPAVRAGEGESRMRYRGRRWPPGVESL